MLTILTASTCEVYTAIAVYYNSEKHAEKEYFESQTCKTISDVLNDFGRAQQRNTRT